MRRWLLALVLVPLGLTSALVAQADPPEPDAVAPPARVMSLADAEDHAVRRSPSLAAARHKILAARAQLDEAWRAPFNNVTVTGFLSVSPTARGNPTFSPDAFGQNPFDVGLGAISRLSVETAVPISPWTHVRLGHVRDAARAGIVAAEEELRRTRLELRHNVRRAYFGLLFARDTRYLLDRARGWLRQAETTFEEARRSSTGGDGGAAPPSLNDGRQLRIYRADVVGREAQASQAEHVALATLRFLTDEPGADAPEMPLCAYEGELGPLTQHLTRARLNRPELGMVQAGLAARRAQLASQRWAYAPDIGLGLSASFADASVIANQANPFAANNNNFAFWGGGLVFRWNLDPLTNAARVNRIQEELASNEAQARQALGALGLEVTEVYERARASQIREASYGEAESEAYAWFTSVFTAYQSGVGEVATLILPLREYLTSRFNHLQALHDLAVARSQLALVTAHEQMDGRPAASCGLPPAEATDAGEETDAAVPDDEVERLLRESAEPEVDAGGVATPVAADAGPLNAQPGGSRPRRR